MTLWGYITNSKLSYKTNLQCVVICSRVLEKAVVRVEHVLGEQVEPFPGQAAVIQTHLVVKLDPQLRLEDVHLV